MFKAYHGYRLLPTERGLFSFARERERREREREREREEN